MSQPYHSKSAFSGRDKHHQITLVPFRKNALISELAHVSWYILHVPLYDETERNERTKWKERNLFRPLLARNESNGIIKYGKLLYVRLLTFHRNGIRNLKLRFVASHATAVKSSQLLVWVQNKVCSRECTVKSDNDSDLGKKISAWKLCFAFFPIMLFVFFFSCSLPEHLILQQSVSTVHRTPKWRAEFRLDPSKNSILQKRTDFATKLLEGNRNILYKYEAFGKSDRW